MIIREAPSILQIQLLGGFRLAYDNEPLTERFSPRAQTLLAYLLLACQEPASRAQIAYTLWPNSSDAQSRTNLRRELHGLRKILPDAATYLAISPKTVSWKAGAPFALDVSLFEREIQKAAETESPEAKRLLLEQAVSLYHGELLPGHYDEWLLAKQEELRQAYLRVLEQLIALLYAEREYAAAIQMVQKLLQVDPLHEAGYRQLMELYAQSGKRAQALHTYHSCVTLFERELGVAPGAEVQAMYEQLTQSADAVYSLAESRSGGTELVGRQPEWQMLLSAWRNASKGTANFVLIEGEAGIGKTRLAEELLEWVNRQGIASARTRSFAAEGSLAYAPVIELLRSDVLGAALEKLDDVWLTEIARLLPELLVEHPELPKPEPMTERHQRQRLFEALARAFSVHNQPMLLLIDDLQWCDQETLEWLRFLLRFDGSTSLLIVGTARSEEVDSEHPLRTLTTELQGDSQLTTIELTSLSADETTALALQEHGDNLVDEAAKSIFQHSEGNPLFVVEMVRSGHFESIAEADNGRATELPPKVYAVIQHRLSTLSPIARSIASLAATIGRGFSFEVLVEASDQSEDEVVNGLDELWRRKVVREQGGSGYDFGHDRIREAAYAALSPVKRRVLHRKVAGALELVFAGDLDAVSGQLGGHYAEAGLTKEAVAWYQQAGEAALNLMSHHDAANLLGRALEQLKELPLSEYDVNHEVELLLLLSKCLTRIYGFAAPEIETVTTKLECLLPRIKMAQLRFDMLNSIRGFYAASNQIEKSLGHLEQQFELCKHLHNIRLLIGTHQGAGLRYLQLGQFEKAAVHYERGAKLENEQPLMERTSTDRHYKVICAQWAVVLWLLGYPERAAQKANEGIRYAQKAATPWGRHIILFMQSLFSRHTGNAHVVEQLGEELASIGKQYDIPYALFSAYGLKGFSLSEANDFEQGIRLMRACVDGYSSTRHTMLQPHRYFFLIEGQFNAGRFDDSLATIDEAFALAKYSGQPAMNAEFYRIRGESLLATGASEGEAEVCFLKAISTAEGQAAKMLSLRATMSLSRLWARQGRKSEARQQLQEIYDWFTEGFDTVDLMEARALLDELASKR